MRYDEEPRVLEGPRASSITVQHSSTYRTYFDWDETAGKMCIRDSFRGATKAFPFRRETTSSG